MILKEVFFTKLSMKPFRLFSTSIDIRRKENCTSHSKFLLNHNEKGGV